MKWPEFLLKVSDRVALVGPRIERSPPLVMPTVFVDGGADFLNESRGQPVVRVGDGDSAKAEMDHRLPTDKDYSDLAFVLQNLPLTVSCLEMFGFLGGRRDHELANFGEVHEFLARRTSAVVNFHENSKILVIGFIGSLEVRVEGLFSMLSLAPARVSLKGDCRYPYEGQIPAASSLGISNEGHGLVKVRANSPVYIFLV